ncbi:uncharacterized protein A4U43_C03F11250 [Asparagus officinalis]|uniref:Uncharacterized protein n=1 Tax=Asparagus officinalis TaxID=4686 RepID=A0A5P1F934_ASPOF|nr:uncharacterized protein A4U43_C03F11250 [Asparagus officinalis]
MGSSSRSTRRIFGAIACFLCIGLLVSVALEGSKGTNATLPLSSRGMSATTVRSNSQMKMDPLSATKRRVPNGPDPIHNRYLIALSSDFALHLFIKEQARLGGRRGGRRGREGGRATVKFLDELGGGGGGTSHLGCSK